MHSHRFNATLINNRGRCKCGAWGRYYKKAGWTEVTHLGQIKGLETMLKKLADQSEKPVVVPVRADTSWADQGPRPTSDDGFAEVELPGRFRDPGSL